jgi:hypothetical protein
MRCASPKLKTHCSPSTVLAVARLDLHVERSQIQLSRGRLSWEGRKLTIRQEQPVICRPAIDECALK